MVKYLVYLLLLFACSNMIAQTVDSGQFIIHRHLKVVGTETYHRHQMADGTESYSMDCYYSDRGKSVPLKTSIELSGSGEPVKMNSRGATSRMSQINDTVTIGHENVIIKKDSVTRTFARSAALFPVDGYAPATMQLLLIRWWLKNGRPATVNGLFGPIEIRSLATDTIGHAGGPRILYAIGIKNVIWGWEFLWMDEKGQMAALITINAEGDKIEFIHPDYEDQLLFFAKKSAEHGTKLYIANAGSGHPTAMIHGVLVDIEKGTKLNDATILIRDGKVDWTGPTSMAEIPVDATIIDAKGRAMLPGLWDMHAHLKQVEWGPAYIAAGITTVRDMANEFDFISMMKKSIDAGKGIGPTILRAGIIDGPGPMGNGIMIAETEEQGRGLVKMYKTAGFDQIKIYSQLQPPVIKAVCDEAHREGLSVAGHIPRSITTMQGVDMGMNMISHIPYVMNAFKADTNFMVDLGQPENQAVLKKLLDKKIVVDPTLAIFEMLYRSLGDPITNIEPVFNTLPPKLQDDFVSMGIPPAEAAKRAPVLKGWRKLVFDLHKAGVPIVAGTDMLIPGYTLYRELELYVAAGFTPLEALQSATITPAQAMGLSSRTGNLTKGMDADIILVDGDPLTRISDIRKVSLVMKRGLVYHSAEVHEMIGF